MNTYTMRCFSGIPNPPGIKDGDVFVLCNFSQSEPHTPILQGLTGLTFDLCNLCNCDLPKDSMLKDSLHCHEVRTLVTTLSKTAVDAQRKAESNAASAAEIAVQKQPVTIPAGAKMEEITVLVESKKQQAITSAIAIARQGKPNLDGLKEIDNGDGTLSYYAVTYEAVKPEKPVDGVGVKG